MSDVNGTVDSRLDELLAERRHAILATSRKDGPPQLSPVWYVWHDGNLYVSTSPHSLKARNITRDDRVSVCIDGGWGDFRYAVLSGEVTVVEFGTERQQDMRWRIIRKYHDSDESARAYYDSAGDEEPILLVLRPNRIVYQDFNR